MRNVLTLASLFLLSVIFPCHAANAQSAQNVPPSFFGVTSMVCNPNYESNGCGD